MNNSQGALYFSANIDMTQWRQSMNEMRRDILGLTNTTQQQTKQMDTSFRNLGLGLATYFSGAALGNFANQIINVRGEFQKTEIAFGTMLKSTDKAKELMAQMVELAAKTPFSLQDVSQGAKQLLAFQVPADQVVDTLTRMGNIAAGLGVPLSRINLVYGQVMAKGKLAGDDLRQFTEAGIPMLAELAKKFGTNTAAISKMVSEGKIGFKDVQDVLFNLTNEGGMFFNLMEKQSASLSGRVSNLADSLDQMMNKIGQSNEGFLNSAIDSAAYIVENYETVVEVVGVAIAAYGTYRAALMATVAWQQLSAGAAVQQALAQGTLTTAQSYGAAATVALQRAQVGLNAAMIANPMGVIIGLVAGLTYVIYKNVTATTAWEEAQNRLNESTARHSESVTDQKVKIDNLIATIKDKNTSDKDAASALSTLNSITGGRIKGLTIEGIRLGQNTKAIAGYIEMLKMEARAKALIDSRIAAEKDNQRIDRDDPNRLTFGERFSNFDSVNDFGKTAQQRKKEAMMLARVANNRVIRESDEELMKLRKRGVNPFLEQGREDAAAIIQSGDEVKKAAQKKERDLAEVYSLNSIADLEQRISLWNEALQKASGNTVEELSKNKYGDTVKTGKTVTVQAALDEIESLEKAKAAREKQIRRMSFEEEIAETKRQIEKRDLLLQNNYSQNDVDEMFPEIKNKSYLSYLEETAAALKNLAETGDKTKETAEKILFTKEAIEQYKGHKTYVDALTESIEELKAKYSGLQLIDKLTDLRRLNVNETPAEMNVKDQMIKKEQDEVRKAMELSYLQILEQQKSFEEKSLALQVKYDGLRALAKSDAERAKIEAAFKAEKSALDAEVFKNSDLYAQAFGNLEKVGTRALTSLRTEMQMYLEANKDLSPENIKTVQEAIEKIDQTIGSRNPFLKLSNAIDEYKKKRKELAEAEKKYGKDSDEYNQKLDETGMSFGNAAAAAGEMASTFLGAVQDIGNAFGSLSDEANQTLNNVQDLLNGVMDAVKGYFSGNTIQMLAGIVQIIAAIVKLANGDVRRAKNINAWQREVNELALAYERLQQIIEKTAGEENLAKQRELISNLQKQQEILRKMRNEENAKKKADKDKVADYTNQIAEINYQIEELVDSFKESVTTTTFKDLATELADAITGAFEKGEDAALAYERVVENVMRNAVANALKVKFIQPLADEFVNKLYTSMGFGDQAAEAAINAQIKHFEESIALLEAKLSSGNLGWHGTTIVQGQIKAFREKLAALQAQLAASQQAGGFDGLTPEEIALLTGYFKDDPRFQAYLDGIKSLDELFNTTATAAEGLKGGIKGVTEKTAGALESQINAIRIYQVEAVNIMKANKAVFENSLKNLVMIEWNTRPLHQIQKDIAEMNSKMKKSLAGVP